MASFAVNVVKLSTGEITAQALAVFLTPVLTRIFTPEAFGIAGLFMTVAGLFGGIACLRYELAILLPKEHDKATNLLAGSILITAVVSIFSILFIFAGIGNHILTPFKAESLGSLTWLIPPMIFLVGAYSALKQWFVRVKYFGRLAWIRVINSVVIISLQLTLGLSGFISGAALILGSLIGQLISTLLLSINLWRTDKQFLFTNIRIKVIRDCLNQYKRFPQFVIWSGLLVSVSLKLPVFVVAYFFSPKKLGFFILVNTVLRIPLNLIGQSISQVFYQQAAAIRRDPSRLKMQTEEIFSFLVSLFVLPALLLAIVGDDLVILAFGKNWMEAGILLQILSFSALVEFVTTPLGSLFNVLDRQSEALKYNIKLMGFRLISLVVGGLTGNMVYIMVFYVIGDCIGRALKFQYIFRKVGLKVKKILWIIGVRILVSLPFVSGLAGLKYILNTQTLVNIIVAIVFIAVYFCLMITKSNLFKQISWKEYVMEGTK
jgi:O-antigen/teichoic acid export membrane protein